jgi:hypothetical protein
MQNHWVGSCLQWAKSDWFRKPLMNGSPMKKAAQFRERLNPQPEAEIPAETILK